MRNYSEENGRPVILYSFSMSDIKDELEKLTSYDGKMVANASNSPDILDRLTLTRSENFLADSWIEDSVSDLYDWVSGFSKFLRDGYSITSDCVIIKQQVERWFDRNREHSVERALFNAIVYGVIYRWYEKVYPEGATLAQSKAVEFCEQSQHFMNSQNRPLRTHDDLFGYGVRNC